jgi:iron-sulfur cluster repair protein YtfE (RIC family)
MRADEVLIAHHEMLRSLLAELEGTTRDEPERRRDLLDTLTSELGIHTQIEDELFYPAVKAVSRLVWIAHAEHRQIDDQLATILRTHPGGDRFADELRVLRAGIEHHAAEEEREMFPESHALGDAELEALGKRLAARQQQLRRSRLAQFRLRVKRETLRRI